MSMSHAPVTMDAALAGRKTGFFADRGIIKVNLSLALSLVSSYATGYDGSMMNGLQSLDTWNAFFNQPRAETLGLLNAIQNIGQLAALPFCAIACDYFGRRPVLLLGAFFIMIGVVLQGAAQNTGMFIAARGIIGFGLAFNITAAPLLIMELAFPTQKGQLVSVYNALWSLGAIVAAWTTYGTFRINNNWGWRIPSLLQALASILQLCSFFWIIESPRWLISKGRNEEAIAIITEFHANSNPNDPIVIVEFEEIKMALQLEEESKNSTSYASFFKTKGNRIRFFIILAVGFFSQWSGNGLISYYLTLILDSIGYKSEDTQTLINAILTIWNFVMTMIFALLVNRFKRRTMFLVSTIGMLITYVVWTGLEASYELKTNLDGTGNAGVAKAVLAMIFLYNLAFSIGWGPLQVTYVVEILPYNLRARGLVLYNLFVAAALIFNQYANPIAVTRIKWKYYIVYDVWILVELLVVYLLFVETSGASLEEVALIIDGDEAREHLIEEVTKATEHKVSDGTRDAKQDEVKTVEPIESTLY